jgi:hypothetical protein
MEIKPDMKVSNALLGAIASAIGLMLLVGASKYKDVPEDVSILKAQRIEDVKRADRTEAKLDKVADDESKILAILQERSKEGNKK